MADPKQIHITKELKHSSPFTSCRFDPQGRYVFAGAEDSTVQRWELASGTKTELKGHESWVRSIAFSPQDDTLITGGYDGRLIWWPAAEKNPQPQRTIEAHQGWIRSIAISPDGTLLASGGNDHLVKIWDTSNGKLVRTLSGHASHVYSTLFHPAGKFLLSGDLQGEVRQWDLDSGKRERTFDAKALHSYNGGQGVHYGGVRSLAISLDGKYLACSGLHKATNPLGAVNEPLVVLFDWESQKKKQDHIAGDVKGIAWQVVYHPDSYLIGASGGSGGGFVIFWKPEQNKEFFKFKMPNTARDLSLHPDGMQIATAHFDRKIRISSLSPKAAS